MWNYKILKIVIVIRLEIIILSVLSVVVGMYTFSEEIDAYLCRLYSWFMQLVAGNNILCLKKPFIKYNNIILFLLYKTR